MTKNKPARITKKYICETLDHFLYPSVGGASFLDGLMSIGHLRYTMYAKSWQAAHDGAGLLANKLIEAEFPVRTLIQLHQVQMGESRGKWKVEAWLDLISPPGVVVRLK